MDCAHDELLTAETEGWENPTEPLQVRVTCGVCGAYLTVVIEDVSLREWNPPEW